MKLITVYRLENSNGVGPFQGGHRDHAEKLKGHDNPFQFDNRLSDRRKKSLYKGGWVYGWDNEESFDIWMNGQEEYFRELGYNKVKYQSVKYRVYGGQEFWSYCEEKEDWIKFNTDGNQVIFKKFIRIKEEKQ
jgi:hypothetical protein